MKLPKSEHTSRAWRIHEIAPDFELEDVWALPTPGGRHEFPRLVELMQSFDPGRSGPPAVRALFALRWKLGELFGWDGDEGFRTMYTTDDEWAAEIENRTVHGILHVGWVRDGERYRGQLAVLVKRNGLLGAAYMAAIKPFRYAVVYPQMLAAIGREWESARGRSVTRAA